MLKPRTTPLVHPVRRERLRQGLGTVELADLAGVSPTLVSLVESWRRKAGPRTKVAFARALGVRVKDLFDVPQVDEVDREVP